MDYKTKEKMKACVAENENTPREKDPQSALEAFSAKDKNEWQEGMLEELENLMRNNTWTFVPRTNDTKTIRIKWVFK